MSVLLRKGYVRYPIRKRYQLVDSLLVMLQRHINRDQVTVESLLEWISMINEEYLVGQNINKVIDLFDKY